jgi:hypothetical protein
MAILTGAVIDLLPTSLHGLILTGIYTVDQNERAVVTITGRAKGRFDSQCRRELSWFEE